jgi:hypothetical protein
MKNETPPRVFLLIFETTIGGQLAQTEITTIKDPMNSRQIRRDCEETARLSFAQLSPLFDRGQKIKCVECIEFKAPEAPDGAGN